MADNVIETERGCHEWQGYLNHNDYGRVTYKGKKKYTHRLRVECELGRELEPHEIVLHGCDNPMCCRIEHLTLGTLKDNSRDMHGKGRAPNVDRSKKLNVETVRQIKIGLHYDQGIYQLAERFTVPRQTIRDIKTGKTWGHVKIDDPQVTLEFDPYA